MVFLLTDDKAIIKRNEHIGEILRAKRMKIKKSVRTISDQLEKSISYIYAYERGNKNMPYYELVEFAKAYEFENIEFFVLLASIVYYSEERVREIIKSKYTIVGLDAIKEIFYEAQKHIIIETEYMLNQYSINNSDMVSTIESTKNISDFSISTFNRNTRTLIISF